MELGLDPLAQTTSVEFDVHEGGDEDLVGRCLDDRFDVRRLLGAGAHGAVYEAWDRQHDAAVALKTLLRVGPDELVRFKQEFRVLSDVSHPNLVTLHELFVGSGGAYFTMELVEGGDFLTWVRGEELDALDESRLREALRQLARGLSALHGFGLLHRDLKPSNVLVRADGQVLVADFGLARPMSGQDSERGLSGTPAYMSPEQAADLQLSAASDWYSVGVMLYEALTGVYPFGGLSGMGLMMAKQLQSPGRPSAADELEDPVPPDLDRLCEALLDRDPEARPRSAEVLRGLGAGPADAPAGLGVAADDDVFVGRADELGRLTRRWRALRDARPNKKEAAVVFIEGPSGGGKSALLRQFVQGSVEGAGVVVRGRCYERESVPYKGLDAVVDSLRAHLLSAPEVVALELPGAAALARLFPVLRDVPGIGDRAAWPIEDPLEQRRQAVDALRELLRRLGAVRPLVVIVDDLQWCGADTAGVIADVLRPSHRPGVLFIGAYRSEDAEAPALNQLQHELAGIDALTVETMALQPLDERRATELATSLLAGTPKEDRAQSIAAEAEGNPLFVAELVRHALSGSDERGDGSLESVAVQRAAQLPEAARRILALVAVAQRPIAQGLIERAAGGMPGWVESVALLRARAFVRTRGPDRRDTVEPFHARIGAAIAASLPAEVLAEHHDRLAEVLVDADGDLEAIAGHLLAAGHNARALDYLERASIEALEALAFGRVTRLCALLLEQLPAEDRRREGVLRRSALALAYDGRAMRAAHAFLAAAELADEREVLELRRAAAEQLLRCGRHEEGFALLRRVLADADLHAPAGPRQALVGLLALRAKIRLRGTTFVDRPEADVDPDLLLAIDTTWTAATGLLQSNVWLGQYFQAKHLLLALEGGEPHRLARALAMEGLYTATSGTKTVVEMDQLNEQLGGLSRRLDDPASLGAASLAAGVAQIYRGRFAETLPHLAQAEQIFRERCENVRWEISMVRLFWVLALYYAGDIATMRRVMDETLRDAAERDDFYTQLMMRASFEPIGYLFDDDLAGARRVLTALREGHAAPLSTATHQYTLMLTDSRIARYAGEGPDAYRPFVVHWAAVRRSLMLTKQPFKIFSLHDRAVGALAAARHASGGERRRLVARARKDARTLAKLGTRWSRSMALPIFASLAAADGEPEVAQRQALQAERAFAESGLKLYRFALRRRRGECAPTGGDALVAEADRELTALGVANPVALVDMLAPTVVW